MVHEFKNKLFKFFIFKKNFKYRMYVGFTPTINLVQLNKTCKNTYCDFRLYLYNM